MAWIEDAFGVNGPKVYKAVPAFWSTWGYALVVNSGMPTEIDLGHTSLRHGDDFRPGAARAAGMADAARPRLAPPGERQRPALGTGPE